MQPWNAVWLEWQPHRLAGLGQPGATTPVRPSLGETLKTLPQGDAKGEQDMKEGRGPIDNGSDLPVPKVPEGLSLQSCPCSPIWVDLGGAYHPETGLVRLASTYPQRSMRSLYGSAVGMRP